MKELTRKDIEPQLEACIKEIGRKVRELRKEKKLTQQELAFSINCDKGLISGIETGRFHNLYLHTIIKIAMALDVSPSYLITY